MFKSLSDATRRDILRRLSRRAMSVGEIAGHYELTFAGVAKHLAVLQHAGLVSKTRDGKKQVVAINPKAMAGAGDYFEQYRQLWEQRLDSLDRFLKSTKSKKGD